MSVGASLVQVNAVGFVETRSFVCIVQAADAMLKAADIRIERYEKLGNGLVAVSVTGDIGSVRVAVEAGLKTLDGKEEYSRGGIIANPHEDLRSVTNVD